MHVSGDEENNTGLRWAMLTGEAANRIVLGVEAGGLLLQRAVFFTNGCEMIFPRITPYVQADEG
jgi:hypothetical protein